MGSKTVVIVVAILAVIGILGMTARFISAEGDIQTLGGLPELNEETVDRIILRNNAYETVVEKIGDDWKVEPYPVVRQKFEEMWSIVSQFDGAELIATNPDNHALMGVAPDNATLVEFWSEDELLTDFLIGDQQFAPIGERLITPWTSWVRLCYLRHPDENEVYGVFCEFPDYFIPNSMWWKNPIVMELPRDQIESIAYQYSDQSFDVKIQNAAWVLESSQKTGQIAPGTMLALLQKLELLVTDEFPTRDENLRLNWSIPDITIEVRARSGATSSSVTLLFLRRDSQAGGYYVKDSRDPYAYILSNEQSAQVLKRIDDFLPPPAEDGSTSTPSTTP